MVCGELRFGCFVWQLWLPHLFNSTWLSCSSCLTHSLSVYWPHLGCKCAAFRPAAGPGYWFLCRVSSALRRTTRTCPLFKCKQFAAVGFALPSSSSFSFSFSSSSSARGMPYCPVSIPSCRLNVLSLPCRIISPDIWSYRIPLPGPTVSHTVASSPNPKLMVRLTGCGRGTGICSDCDRYAQMSRSRSSQLKP